jgi:hypothetical protein
MSGNAVRYLRSVGMSPGQRSGKADAGTRDLREHERTSEHFDRWYLAALPPDLVGKERGWLSLL